MVVLPVHPASEPSMFNTYKLTLVSYKTSSAATEPTWEMMWKETPLRPTTGLQFTILLIISSTQKKRKKKVRRESKVERAPIFQRASLTLPRSQLTEPQSGSIKLASKHTE
jgi:CelD/BcsL family acetyltransferase involved in cellulose biosynthesis